MIIDRFFNDKRNPKGRFNYNMSKQKNIETKKSKKKAAPKRYKNFMYTEAIACCPERWFDKRFERDWQIENDYKYKEDDDQKEWEKDPTQFGRHKDGTPIKWYNNAILDMNRIKEDLEERFPKGTKFGVIIHDCDVYDDGQEKETHVHIGINFENGKSVHTVRKLLGLYDELKENYIQIMRGKYAKQATFSYLPHHTEEAIEHKHDYWNYLTRPSKCTANFDLKGYIESVENRVKAKDIDIDYITEQIKNGDIIEYDIFKEGAEKQYELAYQHYKRQIKDALEIRNKKVIAQGKSKDDLIIAAICGGTGQGKTQTAIDIAENRFRHCYVTGASNDPMQDYMGQEVLIMDDIRPNDFDGGDWLKLLDPYNVTTSVKSRYFNKPLPVKMIILTIPIPFEVFCANIAKDSDVDEPLDQFLRRFSFVMEVSNDLEKVCKGRQMSFRNYVYDEHVELKYFNKDFEKELRAKRFTKDKKFKFNDEDLDVTVSENMIEVVKKYEMDYANKDYCIGRVFVPVKNFYNEKQAKRMRLYPKNQKEYPVDFTIRTGMKELDELVVFELKEEERINKVEAFIEAYVKSNVNNRMEQRLEKQRKAREKYNKVMELKDNKRA